ncbi:MAG: sigma-54-dependent transcriptional regulator [Myxococcota bacterium]
MHPESGPPRLLLIESHGGLRNDLENALSRAGYRVAAFADALDLAARGKTLGRPALQLIDPTAEGAEAWLLGPSKGAEEVRDACPTLVLAPAHATAHAATGWAETGYSILYKPFSVHQLEQRIVELVTARQSLPLKPADPMLLSEEPAFLQTLERAKKWARRSFSICIEGEIGTGRRALARAIHEWGHAARRPYLVIETSSVESIASSELYSLIEHSLVAARGGTLVLVEPDEWPTLAGEALIAGLRDLQGEEEPRCLVISKQSLSTSVREGRLAVELEYRLDAAQIQMPPIRERMRDQLLICRAVARRVAREMGMRSPEISTELVALLAAEGFPGNQLGLESRLRSALVQAGEEGELLSAITRGRIPSPVDASPRMDPASLNLKTLERETIIRALAHWEGNRTRASETLGISVRTLRNKIREYELR